MKFFIDESDKRNIVCKNLLLKCGYTVYSINYSCDNNATNNVFVFSPAKKFNDEELIGLPNNITLFAGSFNENQLKICDNKGIKYKNVLKNEKFAIKNAILTAEGVLALILENTPTSLNENKYLILGGGRIAKSLSIMFGKLGLEFAIGTFNEIKYPEYFLYTNYVFLKSEIFDALQNYDVIINTIPNTIFDIDNLEKIKMDTLFIETASVDCMDRGCDKKFTFLPAPALPQKYSAQSAGKVLFETILEELDNGK